MVEQVTMSEDIHPLVIELKDLIGGYLLNHPHMSLNAFSKRCSVATSTLRRILHLETKQSPNPSTVLSIVSTIKKERRIQQLLSMFTGEIQASLARSYSFVGQYAYRPELSEILVHRESYIIYKLAANRVGTTKDELIGLLGRTAEEKIEELLSLELIYEFQGRLHAKEKNFILSEDVSKKHVSELLRFTSFGSDHTDKSIFKNLSESIDEETYEKIWALQKETNEKICSLIQDKKHTGPIPFFFTCVLDTMEVPGRTSHPSHHTPTEYQLEHHQQMTQEIPQ
jgi:hypothetical protein